MSNMNRSKKSAAKIILIVAGAVLILIAAGITGYLLYQKHSVKPEDKITDNSDDGQSEPIEREGSEEQDINDKPEEIVEQEEMGEQTSVDAEDFTTSTYEQTYMEQDKEILTVSIELPVLTGENPAYEAINQVFEDAKEKYIKSTEQMEDYAREESSQEYFLPHSFGVGYSVAYNNNKILCIVLDGYTYSGGAHGYPLKDVYTFNLSSGLQQKLSYLILADTKLFSSLITDEFQRMYDEAPEEYWEDAPDIVKIDSLDLDNLNYYLTEDSICIYYFPYELGSYARGFVEIVIPYEGNEWMFRFLK